MNPQFIPPKTAALLNQEHPRGTRHQTIINLSLSLIGNGMPPAQVFAELRGRFDPDVTDKEISDAIGWAQNAHPKPSARGNGHVASQFVLPSAIAQPPVPKRSPLEHADWWLSGKTMTLDEFIALGQLPIPEDRAEALILALEMLYESTDNLNVVTEFSNKDGRVCPRGPGRIMSRDRWIEELKGEGIPESAAGAWVRPNPCKAQGSGSGGAICDSDIVRCRFLLLESDCLPIEKQLALFARLKLPIALAVSSGGSSVHAWVRLDSIDEAHHSEMARRILANLQPFGIDQANKNPSRLSRLPSAIRWLGAKNDGYQRLLWVNPKAPALDKNGLDHLEASLECPALEEKPFRGTTIEAMGRYQYLAEHPGEAGIQSGFHAFDRDSGGFRVGQMTVISAETNAGKSTVALNIAMNALIAGKGVALFSLEMTTEEVTDIIFARMAKVNRSAFNTGAFEPDDLPAIMRSYPQIAAFRLWLCDEASITVAQIRKRVLLLKREFDIELVVIDYAQIVCPEDSKIPREQQIAGISRAIRAMAKDAKVAVIVLSQVNDDGKLRESRVPAHDSHNVISLENHEGEKYILFRVTKGRLIPKKEYRLEYDPRYAEVKMGGAKIEPEKEQEPLL